MVFLGEVRLNCFSDHHDKCCDLRYEFNVEDAFESVPVVVIFRQLIVKLAEKAESNIKATTSMGRL